MADADSKPKRKLKNESKQAKKIRAALALLDISKEQLAEQLGVSPHTLSNWLLPPGTSERFRPMSKTAELLLDRIVAEAKKATRQ